MPIIREDMAEIRVVVGGRPYGDSWAEYEGAVLTKDVQKTRAGGMGSEQAVGGQASRDDVTVRIQFSDIVAGWHKALEAAVSADTPSEVGLNFLGPDKQPIGFTQTVRGIIQSAALPNMNANSGDIAFYEVTVSLNELSA